MPESAQDFMLDLANLRRIAEGVLPYRDRNNRLNAEGLEKPASRQASNTVSPDSIAGIRSSHPNHNNLEPLVLVSRGPVHTRNRHIVQAQVKGIIYESGENA